MTAHPSHLITRAPEKEHLSDSFSSRLLRADFLNSPLARLAQRAGIELEYLNAAGEQIFIEAAAVRAILSAMNLVADSETEAEEQLAALKAEEQALPFDFIRPGKPVENSYIESFNGRLRDECLNVEVFFGIADVRDKLERWRQDYNQVRPHSALRDNAPACFAAEWKESVAPGPEQVLAPAEMPATGKILEVLN